MNNHGNRVDGSYNSMIDDTDGDIPSPLIIITCTVLRHPLLKSQVAKDKRGSSENFQVKAESGLT